jgi:hypothetical protein
VILKYFIAIGFCPIRSISLCAQVRVSQQFLQHIKRFQRVSGNASTPLSHLHKPKANRSVRTGARGVAPAQRLGALREGLGAHALPLCPLHHVLTNMPIATSCNPAAYGHDGRAPGIARDAVRLPEVLREPTQLVSAAAGVIGARATFNGRVYPKDLLWESRGRPRSKCSQVPLFF